MSLGRARDHRGDPWPRRWAGTTFFVVLGGIVYATVTPISLRPTSGHLHPERMLAYFALGVVLSLARPKRPLASAVVVTLIACGLEYLQTFVPTRDGRWPDAVEKTLGGVVGVLFAELLLLSLTVLWARCNPRPKPDAVAAPRNARRSPSAPP